MCPSTSVPWLIATLLAGLVGPAPADEPAPAPAPTRPVAARSRERAPVAPAPAALDPVREKADAEARLKILDRVGEKDMTPAQKMLRDVLNERLRWIEEFQKAAASWRATETPRPTPEAEAAERRADLERADALLAQASRSGDVLLPESFRLDPAKLDDARLATMRDAIEVAKTAQNDRAAEFERLRAEPAARATLILTIRTERDRINARLTTLPSRRIERETALTAAADDNARLIARDRLTNIAWEAAVENERLHAAESSLSLETRRAVVDDVAMKAKEQNLKLARQTVAVLTERYRAFAERQKRDLNREAAVEASRADRSGDPLEKFLARRNAELLALQAQIAEDNKSLSASQSISLEEQTALAARAAADFADLKQVVQENRVGGLVALRLNNDFRRISRERAMILRNELAQSGAANTYYENALTEAELAYFNDARDDRFEHESLIDALPEARRAAALTAVEDIEARHKKALKDRRDVLDKLLAKAEATYRQVTLRLKILDEQYAFVRTNIFWVRDSEPLGESTLRMARKDAGRLLASLIRLGAEPLDPGRWSPITAEFTAAAIAAALLPLGIWRARVKLRAILARS